MGQESCSLETCLLGGGGGWGQQEREAFRRDLPCERDQLDHHQELGQASKLISETTFESLVKFHSRGKKTCVYLHPELQTPCPKSILGYSWALWAPG